MVDVDADLTLWDVNRVVPNTVDIRRIEDKIVPCFESEDVNLGRGSQYTRGKKADKISSARVMI